MKRRTTDAGVPAHGDGGTGMMSTSLAPHLGLGLVSDGAGATECCNTFHRIGSGGGGERGGAVQGGRGGGARQARAQAIHVPGGGAGRAGGGGKAQMSQLSRSHNMPRDLAGYERHLRKIHCEGYLERLSKNTNAWRRRWFLLKDGALSYFRDHKEARAYKKALLQSDAHGAHGRAPGGDQFDQHLIPLDMVEAVRTAEDLGENVFRVISAHRDDLILKADNKDEMQSWLFGFHGILASIIARLLEGTPDRPQAEGSPCNARMTLTDIIKMPQPLRPPSPQLKVGSLGGPLGGSGEWVGSIGGSGDWGDVTSRPAPPPCKVLGHGHGREKRRSMGVSLRAGLASGAASVATAAETSFATVVVAPHRRSTRTAPPGYPDQGAVYGGESTAQRQPQRAHGEEDWERPRAQSETTLPRAQPSIVAVRAGVGPPPSWRPPLAARPGAPHAPQIDAAPAPLLAAACIVDYDDASDGTASDDDERCAVENSGASSNAYSGGGAAAARRGGRSDTDSSDAGGADEDGSGGSGGSALGGMGGVMTITAPLDVPLSVYLSSGMATAHHDARQRSSDASGLSAAYSAHSAAAAAGEYAQGGGSGGHARSLSPGGSLSSLDKGGFVMEVCQAGVFDLSLDGLTEVLAETTPDSNAPSTLSPAHAASLAASMGLVSPLSSAYAGGPVVPWAETGGKAVVAAADAALRYQGEYHDTLPCRPEQTCNRGAGGDMRAAAGRLWWTSGVCSIIGRRDKQEDRYCAVPQYEKMVKRAPDSERFAFFGVYDGHCGYEAAQYLSDSLHVMMADNADNAAGGAAACDLRAALRTAFLDADTEFLELSDRHNMYCGSTALVALIRGNRLVVGNLGDCEAVLCRAGAAVSVSERHKPDNPDEVRRIVAANGWVTTEKELFLRQLRQMDLQDPVIRSMASEQVKWTTITRTCGELSVSRAIGDRDFKGFTRRRMEAGTRGVPPENPALFLWPQNHSGEFYDDLLVAHPDFHEEEITDEDQFLLLACDGLWDVLSHGDAVKHTLELLDQGLCAQGAAQQLCELATRLGTSDNVTVIIVSLHHHPPSPLMPRRAA